MSKLYKISDELGVVRIFSNKQEAGAFMLLDKSFKIQTIKVQSSNLKTNKFNWSYKVLGDSIL